MILFDPIFGQPEDLGEKATEAWGKSLYVWKARYVCGDDPVSHTDLAYLGLVPLSLLDRRGYWWLDLLNKNPSRALLREAKQAFADFDAFVGWKTYAHTEVRRPEAGRFLRFFDFRLLGQRNGQNYYER